MQRQQRAVGVHASGAKVSRRALAASVSGSACERGRGCAFRGCDRVRDRELRERARGCGRRVLHLSRRACRRAGLAC